MKKIMKLVSTIILICLAISAASVIFIVIQSKGDIEKAPSVFGYKPLTILSNSMQPTFDAGDVILINTEKSPTVKDVITYKHPDGIIVTHRATNIVEKEGSTYFEAKGDNNNVGDEILIPQEDILGVQNVVIPKAGYVAEFVSGPIGFFLLIALPILGFIIIEIFQRLGIIGSKKEKQQVQA